MRNLGNSGFSQLELLCAVTIMALGFYGIADVLSTTRGMDKSAKEDRTLSTLATAINPRLARDLKATWLAFGAAQCTATPGVKLDSFSGETSGPKIVDAAELEKLLPPRLPDGSENPIRTAIDKLIAAEGPAAAEKCSDTSLAQSSDYRAISISAEIRNLCRCAAAVTPYGTLQPAATSFESKPGMYSCAMMPAPEGSGRVLVQSSLSFAKLSDNSVYDCNSLKAGPPADAIAKLSFTYSFVGSSASPSVSGTYFVE